STTSNRCCVRRRRRGSASIDVVLPDTPSAPLLPAQTRPLVNAPAMRAQEIIGAKRDGAALSEPQIDAFVRGLVAREPQARWSEGQVAALTMAVCLNGMTRAETVALTRAMTASGTVLDWSRERFAGPLLDKHSTGGVGDKVSLVLAPLVAACGGV